MFFVQINHTGKGFLFLIFREIKLRKYSSLHKLFYGLYTFDLARLLVDMIETDKYGYYHATDSELPETASGFDDNGTKTGYISWYDFTKEIYRQAGYDTKVTPVTTEEYGLSKAVRPFNSRLDKSKLVENGFKPLPTWPDAVHRYLEILKKQGFFEELK